MTGSKPSHRPLPPGIDDPKTEVALHTRLATTEEWQAEYARVVEKWGHERTVLHTGAAGDDIVVIYTERPIVTGDGHLVLSLAWPYRPKGK